MISEILITLNYLFKHSAIKPIHAYNTFLEWKRFWKAYNTYIKLAPTDKRPLYKNLYPCLEDDTQDTPIEPIYFYQDTWAFERIVNNKPKSHIDIGSHHKFVAFLSKVIPVTFVDIRPFSLPLDSITFKKGSLSNLPFQDNSVSSLSCLCVIEHIGLGRYGDPIDPFGTEKSIKELKRVLKPGGNLYLSVPLDDSNKIYFNAHRAFKEEYMFELFEPLEIMDKKYIYGDRFTTTKDKGFGTGCYHLKGIA